MDKEKVLEGLIFIAGDQISKKEIMNGLELTAMELDDMIENLKSKYQGGITLKVFGDKYSFATAKDISEKITQIINPIKEKKFSNAVMEVLSIIAYKQPITRVELENVRGVSCDYAVGQLLKDGIIQVVGHKDVIGKPRLFATTSDFLKKFNLESLMDLPDYNLVISRIDKIKDQIVSNNPFFGEVTSEAKSVDDDASSEKLIEIVDVEDEVAMTEEESQE